MTPRRFALCLVGAIVACRSEVESGVTSCPRVVWYLPSSASANVSLVGDFNGWSPSATPMNGTREDGYRVAEIPLGMGEQRYAIVEDGVWRLDREIGTSAYYEGHEVTWLSVSDCRIPRLAIDSVSVSDNDGIVSATLTEPVGEIETEFLEGDGDIETTTTGAHVEAHVRSMGAGRSRVALRSKSIGGVAAAEVVATLWNEATAFEFRDAIVYQVVTDRFRSDRGALSSPASPADRAGGTFKGVEAAVRSGELSSLGVNVLWLSPAYENPSGLFAGSDGRMYSGYHGYWPKEPLSVDPRFGTEAELTSLIRSAHLRGMRVVFDVVPNHVHEEHPYVREHPGWFNGSAGACTCGQPGCDWATHMQECWFAPYLPDLDWKNGEVATQVSKDITEWVSRFGADGVRIDAVPMMPRSATRRIAASLRAAFDHPGYKTWVIGENFTGPGGVSLLAPYLGPQGLDSEFHFPLMWSMRSVIAEGQGAMSDIADTFDQGEVAWAGSGATMGLMIGNHDVARFASVSVGDAGGDGWSEAAAAADASVFAKQGLALGLVATLPGAPFLYYGDEIALTGRGDPDTRRAMPNESDVSPQALGLRDTVKAFLSTRAKCELLRRGIYTRLYADRERMVFARSLAGRSAIVVATRTAELDGAALAIPLSPVAAGNYVDAVRGAEITVDPELTSLPTEAFSVRVFLPKGDACLSP